MSYAHARAVIRNADLLLFRSRALGSRLIQAAGRSPYSHAARAVWTTVRSRRHEPVLLCCEAREFRGCRAVTLSSQVQRYSGLIDVYEPTPPHYDRDAVAHWTLRQCGRDYGWFHILLTSCAHLVGLRMFVQPSFDDAANSKHPPYCSALCAAADRRAGKIDPVPNLADHCTEPGDLARSALYRYAFTLLA